MPSVPYLTETPTGADMNRIISEFDRRLSIAHNGNSPLVPCVRGSAIANNAELSPLWDDMFDRSHDLLGYRFSFTSGSATPYHALAAIQVGTWPDYDHAALQAIAAAATTTSQNDDLRIVTVTTTADTQKLEGSLEAHTRLATTGPNIGAEYFINVTGRPLRFHEYAVAELVCEGKTTFTVPREWDRFACFRVHNLSGTAMTVTVEKLNPSEVPDVFEVKPYGVQAFRRAADGFYDRTLTYFWRWRNSSNRPVFLEAAGVTAAGYCVPEQSARANPLARPFGILDWFSHYGLKLDPRVLCDQGALYPMFPQPSEASFFGDLIHYRGVLWSIAYPTDTGLAPIIGKGEFKGYATLIGDFASIGISATESSGVITLARASDADGDAANGLDVFAPSTNLLNGSGFRSFRTLPFNLEASASLRWSHPPFTAAVTTSTITVKTLTDADPVTYSTATATVPRLAVSPLRQSVVQRARTLNVATITTVQAHGFTVGQVVLVYGVGGTGYNGQVEITATPTTTTFRYASPGANETTITDGGAGYVYGTPVQIALDASPSPPVTSGVRWQGTWTLTPCGWRSAWEYEVALTGPGLLEDAENASTDGLLDGIYDDITADGIAIHRGQVAIVDQGWPLDTAATVFNAGTGTPHSLTPAHSRRYGVQITDGTLGRYDPGFSGYLGAADGADLQVEQKDVGTFSGLKSLRSLTFRRNPLLVAATHKLANLSDSAHVPILKESVALSDAESIFALRASLATETAEIPAIDPDSAFHILPLLAHHHNLLAWHVNAWTRCAPLCTVMDVIIVGVYDTDLAQDVYFTLSTIPNSYSPGDKAPAKLVVGWNGFDYTATLELSGFTVETEADPEAAALIATADAATATEFCAQSNQYLIDTLAPTPPDTAYWGTVGEVFTEVTPSGTAINTYTDAEQDIRDGIGFWLALYTKWLSADAIKAWADGRRLLFSFEAKGIPQAIVAEDAEANEILLPDSEHAVAEITWTPPQTWEDVVVPLNYRFSFCPKFIRWSNQITEPNFTWLSVAYPFDRNYTGLTATDPPDDVWQNLNSSTGEGGPDLGPQNWTGDYIINLPDNPAGGQRQGSGLLAGISAPHFPSLNPPPNGPDNLTCGYITDGRPASIRACDRGTFRTYAIVNVTSDPTGKLVTDSRLVAYRQYDIQFDSSWIFDSIDNATTGTHAIPRTLIAGDGSILTKKVRPNTVTILDPGEQTGIWRVSTRLNVYLDLQ
jgi:hypothetical protein